MNKNHKKNGKKVLIGKMAQKLLLTKQPYPEILAKLKKEFPDANTTIGALRWYASKMRKRKVRVPERLRSVKGEG